MEKRMMTVHIWKRLTCQWMHWDDYSVGKTGSNLGGCEHAHSLHSCPTLCDPMVHNPPVSSVHGIFSARTTGVGFHVLLQGIFPTQRWNPCVPWLLHCKWIFYCWAIRRAPLGQCQILAPFAELVSKLGMFLKKSVPLFLLCKVIITWPN